jgi:hypothetical protein
LRSLAHAGSQLQRGVDFLSSIVSSGAISGADRRPIVIWAMIGGLFLALQAYVPLVEFSAADVHL